MWRKRLSSVDAGHRYTAPPEINQGHFRLNASSNLPRSQSDSAHAFIFAWVFSLAFYFLEYAVRSAPAVMIPQLSKTFGVSTLGVSGILGTYYYTYSSASLVAGILLDRLGAKYVVSTGMAILGLGCLLYMVPQEGAGYLGRLLQGAGSAFAFTGAVYLASHGLSAQRLATAIGVTQCVGMLGGTAGQLVVGRWIANGLSMPQFWGRMGVVVLVVAAILWWITPKEILGAPPGKARGGILDTYKIVFSNPQSYLCGLAAGLLFVPTTVGDMVWGVRLFETDKLFSFSDAVFDISMVPLGWVFGCPLLGWLADWIGRRKPVYLGGAAMMLIGFVQLIYAPALLPTWLTLFILGVASGAAMIPYTIIKEVNPDEVKGSATGAINFLTFAVTAGIGPLFADRFGKTLGIQSTDATAHFRQAGLFWIFILIAALVVGSMLRETGRAHPPRRLPRDSGSNAAN
jgi:MFS family permease